MRKVTSKDVQPTCNRSIKVAHACRSKDKKCYAYTVATMIDPNICNVRLTGHE